MNKAIVLEALWLLLRQLQQLLLLLLLLPHPAQNAEMQLMQHPLLEVVAASQDLKRRQRFTGEQFAVQPNKSLISDFIRQLLV